MTADSQTLGQIISEFKLAGLPGLCFVGPERIKDYWGVVADELMTLLTLNDKDVNETPALACNAAIEVLDYITRLHVCHANAISALVRYNNAQQPFVLYLRNFSNSGRWMREVRHNQPDHRFLTTRGVAGDQTMIPLLQNHFGGCPVVCLSSPEMIAFNAGQEKTTYALRAHGYNWEAVVLQLARAAKTIVLFGESHNRSVERETDILRKIGREHDVAVIVRHEMRSEKSNEFHQFPNVIDFYDFLVAEWDDISLIESTTPTLSGAGMAFLDSVYSKSSAPFFQLKELALLRCFVLGRDFVGLPQSFHPNDPSLCLQVAKMPWTQKLVERHAEFQSQKAAFWTACPQGIANSDNELRAAFLFFFLASQLFATAIEVEVYPIARDACIDMCQALMAIGTSIDPRLTKDWLPQLAELVQVVDTFANVVTPEV